MGKPTKLKSGNWRIRWLDHAGKRQSATFANWNEAQQQLRRVQADADAVRAGQQLAPPADRTFEDLSEYWMTRRAIHKRSRHHDQSIIRCHLQPAFGGLLIRQIEVERIDTFMAERTHLSPKTVNNLVTLLLSMLKCAVDLGWLSRVPRVRKPRIRAFSTDYRYLRSRDEVQRFLAAAADNGDDAHALYATAVFTGLREGELAALRWSDVDFERQLITVQRSFHGPTKAGDVRYVPIMDVLRPILRAWQLKAGGCWLVFPNEREVNGDPQLS